MSEATCKTCGDSGEVYVGWTSGPCTDCEQAHAEADLRAAEEKSKRQEAKRQRKLAKRAARAEELSRLRRLGILSLLK